MLHNTFDQFNDFVTRIAAAAGTVAAEHAHAMLDTALAREVLAAIVGGQVREEEPAIFDPGRFLERHVLCTDVADNPYHSNKMWEGLAPLSR